MPIKVYSKEKKEEIQLQLLDTALTMYSINGIRNVTLMTILKAVGISKPFFYTFFDSVQEFVICVLEYQWSKLPNFFQEIDSHTELNWEEKILLTLTQLIHYPQHGLLIMTQEEEVWVRSRIDDDRYHQFMNEQTLFFRDLLIRWQIPVEKCKPNILANMIISMILIRSSSKRSLPFLYLDDLDETAEVQARSIVAYLKTLKAS